MPSPTTPQGDSKKESQPTSGVPWAKALIGKHIEGSVSLAAVDPANPYGSLLPWPDNSHAEGARPRRVSGARVLLLRGHPVLWIGPRGRKILTFPFPGRAPEESISVGLRALQRLPRKSGKWRLLVQEVDGRPGHQSSYAELMRQSGFARTYRGLELTSL